MADALQSTSSLDDSSAVELSGKIMVAAIIVLFFVIVFVLFLHLYAKWFWWRTAADDATTRRRARRRSFAFAPTQDPGLPALRRGLDPSLLASIPVVLFRSEDFKDGMECAVCLSELAPGEKARLLPKCNHGFHVECIDMWFHSHSTCPLCRNPVGTQLSEDPSSSPESIRLSVSEESPTGDYSTESRIFPTNVLFWGNQTRVTSGGLNLEEEEEGVAASSQPQPQPQSQSPYGMLVIDIPRQTAEIFPSVSPSTAGSSEGEVETKSPMTRRLRSFKRLLSREKRVVPRSPGSLDVEQLGKGQSSKSSVDV